MLTNPSALTCRSCGEPLRVLFADLGMTPFSNAFRAKAELAQAEPFYPLRAFVCEACKLVQLQDFGSAEEHFNDDYVFTCPRFRRAGFAHARVFAETAQQRFSLTGSSFVVEIGSNDGYLLQFIKAKAIPASASIRPPIARRSPGRNSVSTPWLRFSISRLRDRWWPNTATPISLSPTTCWPMYRTSTTSFRNSRLLET